jgi:hypothetical protein
MMTFKKYDVNATDIQDAWVATNTVSQEVNIFLNTLGEYEVWVDEEFHTSYNTFFEAQRYAEYAATTTLNWKQ